MYTPKRTARKHEESLLAGSSPFRSLNSSFNQNSTLELHVKKTPSRSGFQVIEQDSTHQLTTFGNGLPVEVAEVLASNTSVASKLHTGGWASVIHNRKLFVWRYTASSVRKNVNCIELQLPMTQLQHQGSLTCVLENTGNDPVQAMSSKTSFICASPEGTLRYWQNINRPAITVETQLNLNGRQCNLLLPVMPHGCILITTTFEMFLISPTVSSIQCRHLSLPTGMLSSLSRRVSSFWSQPVLQANKYPPCLCLSTIDLDVQERTFLAASNGTLQKWEISGTTDSEIKMLVQVDLLKMLKDYQYGSKLTLTEYDSLHVLDMKCVGYGTVLLITLSNQTAAVSLLVVMKTHESAFIITQTTFVTEEFETENAHLVLPVGDYHAYIATNSLILAQSVTNTNWDPVRVEFNASSTILASGCCGTEPVFLTKRHGLVTLKLLQQEESVLFEKPKERDNGTEISEREAKSSPVDTFNAYTTLKTAFIFYSKSKKLPSNLISSLNFASDELSDSILRISKELLDSCPATDASWAAQRNIGLVTSSVLLLNQLQDKNEIFESYLDFLNKSEVWTKLTDRAPSTQFSLYENGERLQSMMTLLDSYERSNSVIDEVINSLDLDLSLLDSETYLSKKDIFFTNVTSIDKFFTAIIKIEASKLQQLAALKEQIELISTVSSLFATCFTAAWQYRQSIRKGQQEILNQYVPWTGSTKGENNRSHLIQQIHLQLQQALSNVDSTKIGSMLTQQVVLMADLLLDGYEIQVNLLSSAASPLQHQYEMINEEYQQERQYVVLSLIELGYYEEATTLAEKYEDFQSLIALCEKLNDREKLENYKNMFQKQGFSEVLYRWYMEKGAWGTLMSQTDKSMNLDKFLGRYENLSWLHYIGNKEFSKASYVLKKLSKEELLLADRKKMMLVLSNLSMLASDETPSKMTSHIIDVDEELELLDYQEKILQILGNRNEETRPLTAMELIQLYLNEDSVYLNVEEMFGVLQLLQLKGVTRESAFAVWTKCIEQDSWEECPQLDYTAVVSQKTFFKCLKRCQDADVYKTLIPNPLELLSRDFVTTNRVLGRQLKACYEVLGFSGL